MRLAGFIPLDQVPQPPARRRGVLLPNGPTAVIRGLIGHPGTAAKVYLNGRTKQNVHATLASTASRYGRKVIVWSPPDATDYIYVQLGPKGEKATNV